MISPGHPGLASRLASVGHANARSVIMELVRAGLLVVAAGLAIVLGLPVLLTLAAAS